MLQSAQNYEKNELEKYILQNVSRKGVGGGKKQGGFWKKN
jgi:hypothetical protein